MSLALSGHRHCIQCQRYETDRRKASVRRCAKHARSKLTRRAARDEIAEGIEMRDDAADDRRVLIGSLMLEVWRLEGCNEPSSHARRAAAIEELNALRRTETP